MSSRTFVLLFSAYALTTMCNAQHASAGAPDLAQLSDAEFADCVRADLESVRRYRKGFRAIRRYVRSQPDLFPGRKLARRRLLRQEEKTEVRDTWKRALDYVLALDSVGQRHRKFYKLKPKGRRRDSFFVGYAAFLAQYAFALEFIERVENDPDLDTILNEPIPELGLPARTYAKFKFRFLNAARATEFGSLTAVYKWYGDAGHAAIRAGIDEDAAVVWRMGRGRGYALTGMNALKIVKDTGFTAWFPVQAGVSEWMGDAKVRRRGRCLITQEQIAKIAPRLEPGDILLERREWYLSNIGLPGFWPHAALYIGAAGQRSVFFDDPTVRVWVRGQGVKSGSFDELLALKFGESYDASLTRHKDGHMPRVIEAMSEGVVLTTLEHSAEADSLAILRPRLSRKQRAVAVYRAFGYVGRPYDFDFDFQTDAALVCTEVIYKAYEPGRGMKGLRLPLSRVAGRMVTPANEIARQFDEQYGTPKQQSDLVVFVDGHERRRVAVESSLAEFRKSWTRPKWHIFAQDGD